MTNSEKTIFIFSNSSEEWNSFSRILQQEGYLLQTAACPDSVAIPVRTPPPDLILWDIRCFAPGGISAPGGADRTVPVIVIGPAEQQKEMIAALSCGAADYLAATAAQAEILARIRPHLSLRESRRILTEKETALQKEIAECKRTEAALRKSEARYLQLFNAMMAGFALHEVICDKSGKPVDYRFLEVNASFEEMTGRTADMLIGKTVREIFPGIDSSLVEQLGMIALTGESNRFISFAEEMGGYLEITAYSPETGKFACLIINITERVKAEKELKIALEKYRTLFTAFPQGVLITDNNGKIVEANQASERLLDMPRNEQTRRLIDSIVWEILHPNGSAMPPEQYPSVRAMRENRLIESEEMGVVQRDGQIRWLNVTSAPIPLKDYGIAMTFSNVTEHKQAKEALQESESLSRAILNALTAHIAVLDGEGNITALNDAWWAFAFENGGGPAAIDIGTNYLEAGERGIHPDDPDNSREALAGIRRVLNREQMTYELVYPCHSPAKHQWFIMRVTPLRHPNRGVVVAHIDITKRYETEEQLKATLAEKEILLREIHHRVKNNMSVITSLLNLQLLQVSDPSVQAALQDSIDRISAMALIHETLYQSGNLGYIEFREYAEHLVRHLLQIMKNKSSEPVDVTVEAPNIPVNLKQAVPCGLILNELITNAFKYAFPSGRGGHIRITARKEDDRISVTVQDNGVGIPEGTDVNTLDSLGLRLVYNMTVHQLRGSFDMKSNGGTLFILTWPLTPPVSR